MTLPQLVDPQLQQFQASNPELLRQPGAPTVAPRHHNEHLGLEIAAAIVLVARLIRGRLQGEHHGSDRAHHVAMAAWREQVPTWLRLVVPALTHAYQRGATADLTPLELESLAGHYAASLGDYLASSSADALVAGMNQQLTAKWNEQVAWQRASAAYGVDKRAMLSYLSAALTASPSGQAHLVSAAARAIADKALLIRADLIGTSEAHTAVQSGTALAWLYLQQQGRLPADAKRGWELSPTESTCAVCIHLAKQQVSLDQPFVMPGGTKIWAPLAHPHCECKLKLIVRHALVKAYDRAEKRDRTGKWTATLERDPLIDSIMAQVHAQQVTEEPEKKTNPLAAAKTNPLAARTNPLAMKTNPLAAKTNPLAAKTNPLAVRTNPLAVRANPLAATETATPESALSAKAKRKLVIRRFLLPAQPKRPPGRDDEPTFYMPMSDLLDAYPDDGITEYDHLYEPGDVFDMDDANDSLESYGDHGLWGKPGPDDPQRLLAVQAKTIQGTFDENHWEVSPEWEQTKSAMMDARETALDEAPHLVEALDVGDIYQIYRWAGVSPPSSLRDMRHNLTHAAGEPEGHESGLAAAYADYMTFHKPRWLGEAGHDVYSAQERAEEDEGGWTMPTEPKQNIIFDRGLHPGTSFFNDGRIAELKGSYVVTHATYHSALGELGTAAPEGVVGWRSLYVAPLGDNLAT